MQRIHRHSPRRTQGFFQISGFSPARPTPGRSRSGFTLVEMLLVLAVLVLFAAMVLPMLSGSYERSQLDGVVEEVRRDLAGTRTFAVEAGVPYQFRYEPGGSRYLIVPHEIDSDAAADGASLSTRYRMYSKKLPEGYRFVDNWEDPTAQQQAGTFLPIREDVMKSFPNANELSSASGWPAVLFSFDGSATAVTLSIRAENKLSRSLSVRELTGTVTVGELKQEQR